MTRPWWLKNSWPLHQPTLVTLGKGLCTPNDLRDLSISFPRNGTIFWRADAWTKKPYAPVSALDLRCPPTKPWNRDVIQIETSLDSSIKIFKVLCFFFQAKIGKPWFFAFFFREKSRQPWFFPMGCFGGLYGVPIQRSRKIRVTSLRAAATSCQLVYKWYLVAHPT